MKKIQKGQCFCLKCGKIATVFHHPGSTKKAVRYVPDKTKPQMQFSLIRKTGGKIELQPHSPTEEKASIALLDPIVAEKGCPPDAFRISLGSKTVKYYRDVMVSDRDRICPYCGDASLEYYLPYSGKYDSYFLFLLGRPGTGKTQFSNALMQPALVQHEQLQSMLTDDDIIIPLPNDEAVQDTDKAAAATRLGKGTGYCFLLQHKLADPSLIYVVDLAGEFILQANGISNRTERNRALIREVIRRSAAGLLVFCDPMEVDAPELDNYKSRRLEYNRAHNFVEGSVNPFPALRQIMSGRIPPVAVVFTGVDTLIEAAEEHGGFLTVNGERVFSAKGLLNSPDRFSIEKPGTQRLRRHMLLSRTLLNRFGVRMAGSDDANTAYFCVSSGRVDLQTSRTDHRFNQWISDPIAWLMARTGIANIRD